MTWHTYWHERCTRADRDCGRMGPLVWHCALGHPGMEATAENVALLRRWAQGHPHLRNAATAQTTQWAEGAGLSEADADALAALLRRCLAHHDCSVALWDQGIAALKEYEANRDRRYSALPPGPTLQGNLTSGGIDV